MRIEYTKKCGLQIIKELKRNGIVSNLIGTLPSTHDIDILIKNRNTKSLRKRLKTILLITSYKATDWGGIFAKTKYGVMVDIFFRNHKKFDR